MTGALPTPKGVLAIGAHPDDVEFGCAATLARWTGDGAEAHLLILTDGAKGSWEPSEDVAALIETRKREAQEAAGVLGAVAVHFLDAVDGELESGLTLREAVCRVIRETGPDVVLGHDPWKRYRLHPDHRHAGFLTVDGVVAARDPHFFPKQGGHHRPSTLLLFEADEADHWEPAEESHLEVKVRALLSHRSQWRSTMGIESESDRAAFEQRVHNAAREAGEPAGLPYAEAFRCVDVD
ncbi:MAG: PIG-L family deacetylase [Actinobacteria bacterium]|nr:PIG-L family deacetylase [Actinomycetota bacterium]